MNKIDSYIQVRIDAATKKRVTEVFNADGITVSEAIRIILRGVAEDGYYAWTPNAEARASMAELEAGGGKIFDSVEDLMKDIDVED